MWSNGYDDDTDFANCWFTKTQKSIYLQNETIFLKKLIHYALRAIIHYDKNIFQAEVLFEISKHVVWHLDEHRKILCCSKTKFGQLSKGQPTSHYTYQYIFHYHRFWRAKSVMSLAPKTLQF